jgi:pSer/pThr/pTyr-binding forkhead associated (FHA) protein
MQQFWDACGAAGPLKVRVEDGSGGADVNLVVPLPFAVIGRDPKADVILDDEGVSRRHAFVQVIAGRVFWIDLGSRTGVALGGVVAPMGWLGSGEELEIGPFRIAISVASQEAEADGPGGRPNPLADRGPMAWPDAALEFPNHPGGASRWRIARLLTLVGRGTDCRLRIGDDDISRFHCALLRTPEGPWVVDLLSRSGIRLEGARVRVARLEPGANLHVGRYRMIVRPAEPSSAGSDDARPTSIPPLPRDQLPEVSPRRRPPAAVDRPAFELPAVPEVPGELGAYIGRMEQMQQQMFDQFHQMMMAMFQAFGTMQRDQMAQVREELDRIRQLGQELQSLKSNPADGPTPSPNDPSGPVPAADRAGPPPPAEPWTPRDRTDREVHDLICKRIAEIEGERQGRWKKVFEMVTGGT